MAFMRSIRDWIGTPSKRLVGSYALDWFMILLTFVIASSLSRITPNMQPFSLTDPSISLPYTEKTKIPTVALFFISTVAPALIIMLVCLLLPPAPATAERRRLPRAHLWRRKLWAWNTAWLGLGLALVSAQLVTDLLKNFFGKPRPDLLSRCNPDLDRIRENALGGYGARLEGAVMLVSHTICQNRDKLKDGFRSFPSGHASISWAGMTYLTLFLCAKFAVVVPSVVYRRLGRNDPYPITASSGHPHDRSRTSEDSPTGYHKTHQRLSSDDRAHDEDDHSGPSAPPVHEQAAAPPLYLVAIFFIPLGVAMYISSTRYTDYRHHGFDILSGAVLGFVSAWFGFRWYHLPLRERSGRSWGARAPERAFGIGVGVGSYVADEDGRSSSSSSTTAPAVNGAGRAVHGDLEMGPSRRGTPPSTSAAAARPGPPYLPPIRTDRQDGVPI